MFGNALSKAGVEVRTEGQTLTRSCLRHICGSSRNSNLEKVQSFSPHFPPPPSRLPKSPVTPPTMAKDKTETEIAAKKEKKDKKRKLEEVEDVEAVTPKKEKKKKRKSEALEDESFMDVDGQSLVKVEEAEDKKDVKAVVAVPLAALVPFANPLADDKAQKKVLKAVKKGMEFLKSQSTSVVNTC